MVSSKTLVKLRGLGYIVLMTNATAKIYQGNPCKKGHTERRVSNNACAVCSREKANAYYESHKEIILERMKDHKKPDPAKKKQWNKKWLDANPDYFNQRYMEKREEILAKNAKYRKENLERITSSKKMERERNANEYNRRLREWKAKNPSKVNAWGSKRRASILQAIPLWANIKAIEAIYESCPIGYHVDHYYPLKGKTVCGLHCETNLQIITADENLQKGNKMPEKFYQLV